LDIHVCTRIRTEEMKELREEMEDVIGNYKTKDLDF